MPSGHGRAALLDAALALFAARGFEGASTRAIAERAGVPQGLVRHHFGSKEGLFREVVDHALGTALGGSGAPPELTPVGLAAAAPQAAPLIALLVHALLEPGPRREWLVEQRVRPLLQRHGPRLAGLLGRSPPLAERDLLALAGALVAPLLLAPLSWNGPASDPAPRLERLLGQAIGALHAPPKVAGPWGSRPAVAPPR